jgi:hypothetical protein
MEQPLKNERPLNMLFTSIERREEGFVIFMSYQGAHYTFRVMPDTGIMHDRYKVFRAGEPILDLLRMEGDWVDTVTRESNGFIREVGKTIDYQLQQEKKKAITVS